MPGFARVGTATIDSPLQARPVRGPVYLAYNTDRQLPGLVVIKGKQVSFEQALATPGCDPRAVITIRRRGRRATLIARMRAARDGPGLTSFALKLPRTLSRGRPRPYVRAAGRRMKPLSRKRLAAMPFPGEVRSGKLVWRGLRTGRRLRRTAVVRLTMTDTRNAKTRLKQRVPVRGKRPTTRR